MWMRPSHTPAGAPMATAPPNRTFNSARAPPTALGGSSHRAATTRARARSPAHTEIRSSEKRASSKVSASVRVVEAPSGSEVAPVAADRSLITWRWDLAAARSAPPSVSPCCALREEQKPEPDFVRQRPARVEGLEDVAHLQHPERVARASRNTDNTSFALVHRKRHAARESRSKPGSKFEAYVNPPAPPAPPPPPRAPDALAAPPRTSPRTPRTARASPRARRGRRMTSSPARRPGTRPRGPSRRARARAGGSRATARGVRARPREAVAGVTACAIPPAVRARVWRDGHVVAVFPPGPTSDNHRTTLDDEPVPRLAYARAEVVLAKPAR